MIRDRLLFFILKLIVRKEDEIMIVVYATLIIKGRKTFTQVPDTIKEEVRDYLVALDCENLVYEQ